KVKSGSPARIGSPSRLSQPTKVPSSMFQPSRGMVIATAMASGSLPDQLADGAGDRLRIGDDGCLERGTVRSRGVHAIEPPDRGVEIVEPDVRHPGRDLGTDAHRREVFVDDHQPPGLADRFVDGLEIQGCDGARVDQLERDSLTLEYLAGLQHFV